jgi:hypothetical protein
MGMNKGVCKPGNGFNETWNLRTGVALPFLCGIEPVVGLTGVGFGAWQQSLL